jgi:hypothetical protein
MLRSQYLDIFVLTIASAIWATFVVRLTLKIFQAQRRKEQEFRRALYKLRGKIINLENQTTILAENEPHYMQTLQAAGFGKLKSIRQALAVAEDSINSLKERGQLSEGVELMQWLLSYKPNMRPPAALSSECIDTLIGWEEHARELLICCTEAITALSNENIALGVKRSKTSRRSTRVNLAELRRWLMK